MVVQHFSFSQAGYRRRSNVCILCVIFRTAVLLILKTSVSQYIYIYIYLLTYHLPAFTVTRKKEKKTPGTRDKNYLESPPGGKRKKYHRTRKRKGQLRHTSWKKSRNMQSVGQKKNKTHRKMPQCYHYKSAQYEVEPITKIKFNRKSEFSG